MKIAITANALHTNTLTGGDKIFVECAKRWILWGHSVLIITTEAGYIYCVKNGISPNNILVWRMVFFDRFGFPLAILAKTILSFFYSLLILREHFDILFASSFFFPDIIPAIILKIRTPAAHLATSFYIFTKKIPGSDYSGGKIKGFFFYLNEALSLFIIKRFGSSALVASSYDLKHFALLKGFDKHRIMAVGGGVDNKFFASVPKQVIRYDAVFVGRFQPQKCIDELIIIWSMVVKKDPKRKLALIGGGPQESMLRSLVSQKHLDKNVHFLGVLDGIEKAMILKSSRMFISASRFDTGNIALDEALACAIPGIVYNLPQLAYSKGVVKIPIGNHHKFCDAIFDIISHKVTRDGLSQDAVYYAQTIDWDIKAKQILTFLSRDGM